MIFGLGYRGYYEISSRTDTNVTELFHDTVRQIRISRNELYQREMEAAQKERDKAASGLKRVLPWQWGKIARCDLLCLCGCAVSLFVVSVASALSPC